MDGERGAGFFLIAQSITKNISVFSHEIALVLRSMRLIKRISIMSETLDIKLISITNELI